MNTGQPLTVIILTTTIATIGIFVLSDDFQIAKIGSWRTGEDLYVTAPIDSPVNMNNAVQSLRPKIR